MLLIVLICLLSFRCSPNMLHICRWSCGDFKSEASSCAPWFSALTMQHPQALPSFVLRSGCLMYAHRAQVFLDPAIVSNFIIGRSQASRCQILSVPYFSTTASILPDRSFGLRRIFLCLLLGFPLLVSLSLLLLSHRFVVGSLLFRSPWYLDAQSTSD